MSILHKKIFGKGSKDGKVDFAAIVYKNLIRSSGLHNSLGQVKKIEGLLNNISSDDENALLNAEILKSALPLLKRWLCTRAILSKIEILQSSLGKKGFKKIEDLTDYLEKLEGFSHLVQESGLDGGVSDLVTKGVDLIDSFSKPTSDSSDGVYVMNLRAQVRRELGQVCQLDDNSSRINLVISAIKVNILSLSDRLREALPEYGETRNFRRGIPFSEFLKALETVDPVLRGLDGAAVDAKPFYIMAAIDSAFPEIGEKFDKNELRALMERIVEDGAKVYSANDPDTGRPCLVIYRSTNYNRALAFGAIAIRNIDINVLMGGDALQPLPDDISFPPFDRHPALIARTLGRAGSCELQYALSHLSLNKDFAERVAGGLERLGNLAYMSPKDGDYVHALGQAAALIVQEYEKSFVSSAPMNLVFAALTNRNSIVRDFQEQNPGKGFLELQSRMETLVAVFAALSRKDPSVREACMSGSASFSITKRELGRVGSSLSDIRASQCAEGFDDGGDVCGSVDLTDVFKGSAGHVVIPADHLRYMLSDKFLPLSLHDVVNYVARGVFPWDTIRKVAVELGRDLQRPPEGRLQGQTESYTTCRVLPEPLETVICGGVKSWSTRSNQSGVSTCSIG